MRQDDDSSEDDRPPPPSKSQGAKVRNDPLTLPELLGEDLLATVLGAIGLTDASKASACAAAEAWCSVNRLHKRVCDSNPKIWQSLIKKIFAPGLVTNEEDEILGKHMIHRTFRDDKNPQEAFRSMCGATGLADTLKKRFVVFACDTYHERQWDQWVDSRADWTGLGEEVEELSGAENNEYAVQFLPDCLKAEDWAHEANVRFQGSPFRKLYVKLMSDNPEFKKLVDVIFKSTVRYLLVDPARLDDFYFDRSVDGEVVRYLRFSDDETDEDEDIDHLQFFNMVGEVLGVFIVCLWQLQRDRDKVGRELPDGGFGLDDEAADAFDKLVDGMNENILTTRLRIVRAIRFMMGEDLSDALELKEAAEEDWEELYDYDSVSDWDL